MEHQKNGANKRIDLTDLGEVEHRVNRRLSKHRVEDRELRDVVWHRNVNQLIQAPRAQDSGIDQLWPIRRTDHEDRLARTDHKYVRGSESYCEQDSRNM